MRSLVHPGWVLAVCSLLGAATCSNKQQDATPAASPAAKPATPASGGNSPAPMAPAATAIKTFPTLDMGGLTERQKDLFVAVANEEFCPCDCPMTLAACLQTEERCPAARPMAEVMLRDIREGIPPDMLKEEVAEAFSGGYSATPRTLILDGYASLGSTGAPITLVEYSDFECPHCRDAAPVLKAMVKKYPSEVRLVFKHFPLSGHVMARDAAVAVEAAGRQGKFWDMHDKVFENQENLSADMLRNLARQVGLDLKRFETDLADPALAARVDAAKKEGELLGVDSTPSVWVNGRKFGLRRTLENFESRLAMERTRGQGNCR